MRWIVVLVLSACSSSSNDTPASLCETQPIELRVHPHAPAQRTTIGQELVDTRGFYGRLYFAYGDLDQNTGPIVVSSYDPIADEWRDHFTYLTERIERFNVIGDRLFAPAADPHYDPNNANSPQPDYAIGTSTHDWGAGGIDAFSSAHVLDAVERAPGDIYLAGWDMFDATNFIITATVWRSLDGGPFKLIFPVADTGVQSNQHGSGFINLAALGGKVYPNLGWTFDGETWAHPAVNLGEFVRPTTFANKIVSSTLGQLWGYDGTRMKNLGVTLLDTPGLYQFTLSPLALFQQTEGHLVAIDAENSVITTTDLETWTCVGKAPADVRSIGSLDGTIYFGGTAGRIYGFPSPSW